MKTLHFFPKITIFGKMAKSDFLGSFQNSKGTPHGLVKIPVFHVFTKIVKNDQKRQESTFTEKRKKWKKRKKTGSNFNGIATFFSKNIFRKVRFFHRYKFPMGFLKNGVFAKTEKNLKSSFQNLYIRPQNILKIWGTFQKKLKKTAKIAKIAKIQILLPKPYYSFPKKHEKWKITKRKKRFW